MEVVAMWTEWAKWTRGMKKGSANRYCCLRLRRHQPRHQPPQNNRLEDGVVANGISVMRTRNQTTSTKKEKEDTREKETQKETK